MADHSFDPDVAALVGTTAATVYKNIRHWCEKNAFNEKNIHDSKAWTYNSATAYKKQFSYLSEKQIRTCLNKLIEHGFIAEGNFNKERRDRTKWYCDLRVKCILPNGQMQVTKRADPTSHLVTPLPNIKPNINPTVPVVGANSKARATRLPDDFIPEQEAIELAISLDVNAEYEFSKFKDYWIGVSGARGTKLDWNATFRNWVRRASEQKRPSKYNSKKPQGQNMIEALASLKEKNDA